MKLRYPMIALAAVALCAGSAPAGAGEADPGKGPNYSRSDRFNVRYTVKDRGGAGLSAMEVWVSSDGGKTWKKIATDTALTGRATVKVEGDGVWDVTTVAVGKAGNREKAVGPNTVPDFRVIVDATPPKVTAKGVADGLLAKPGDKAEISWKAADLNLVPNSVQIQAKLDGEPDWRVLARDLPAEGRQAVEMPQVENDRAQLRVVAVDRAGNQGVAAAGSLVFDGLAPEGRVLGPALAGALEVDVLYEVVDKGPAGLAAVTIWLTADDGRTWKKAADAPADKGVFVKITLPKPGAYGLALAATDKAGNVLPPPKAGAAPQFRLLTDLDAPRLKLLAPGEGQAFAGGAEVAVRWTAEDDNFGEGPITVESSADGGETWKLEGKSLKNTGSFAWKAPLVDSTKCVVRVRAEDAVGHQSQAMSRPFTVAVSAPSSTSSFEPLNDEPPAAPTGGAGPVLVAPGAERPPSNEELLAEARALLARGQNAQALAAAGRVLAVNPDHLAALMLSGRALLASDPAAAVVHLEKASNLDPEAPGLLEDLGQARYSAGVLMAATGQRQQAAADLARAVSCFDRALLVGRDSWKKHYNLGVALVALAQIQSEPKPGRKRAEAELNKSLTMAGKDLAAQAGVTWYQAILREDEGNAKEAIKLWKKAAELYGKDSDLGKEALDRAAKCCKKKS